MRLAQSLHLAVTPPPLLGHASHRHRRARARTHSFPHCPDFLLSLKSFPPSLHQGGSDKWAKWSRVAAAAGESPLRSYAVIYVNTVGDYMEFGELFTCRLLLSFSIPPKVFFQNTIRIFFFL